MTATPHPARERYEAAQAAWDVLGKFPSREDALLWLATHVPALLAGYKAALDDCGKAVEKGQQAWSDDWSMAKARQAEDTLTAMNTAAQEADHAV